MFSNILIDLWANRLWLPLIWNIFNWLYEQIYFDCPMTWVTLYCPFGRNRPLVSFTSLYKLYYSASQLRRLSFTLWAGYICDWHWRKFFQILLEPYTLNYLLSWISFNSFFSWANFHLHLWATYIGFCHLNWINFKCFLSLILSIIFWAEYSLHISITVQVSPLLNEDLLSRTSPPSFPCLRQSGDSSCCFMRHTIN